MLAKRGKAPPPSHIKVRKRKVWRALVKSSIVSYMIHRTRLHYLSYTLLASSIVHAQ